jgi:hypothetical protein
VAHVGKEFILGTRGPFQIHFDAIQIRCAFDHALFQCIGKGPEIFFAPAQGLFAPDAVGNIMADPDDG